MRKVEFERMQDLRSMLMAVAFAASTDDERPDMNGVGLEVFDGELHARATNGQWAMRVRRTPAYADAGFRVLVPLSHVKRLVALIGDGIGQVRILHEQDLVRFEVWMIGRLDLYTGGVAAVPFVDLDKAWPTSPSLPMDAIGFNPSLMASLAKAFGQVAEKPTLRFAFHGDEHPTVVTCEENEFADALIMPCMLKGDDDDADEEEDRQRKLFPEVTISIGNGAERAGTSFSAPKLDGALGRAVKVKLKAKSKVAVKKAKKKRKAGLR